MSWMRRAGLFGSASLVGETEALMEALGKERGTSWGGEIRICRRSHFCFETVTDWAVMRGDFSSPT